MDRELNSIGCVMAIIAFLGLVSFSVFKLAETDAERKEQMVAVKKYMAEKNCKVTGYYGRSGERKVYTCDDGKVWKESDLM